jgi:hypothetical protein
LRTLKNVNATSARKAHGHFYDNDNATILRAAPAAAAAADTDAAAENGPIQGQGGRQIQGHGGEPLPALQNPPTPDLQIDTRQRVQSTSDSKGDYKNALDRTIMSDSEAETPPTRTPPSSPRLRRRPSPNPSPSSSARHRTRNQTNKDGKTLGKLHDQSFPPERKRYERKKK